MYLPGAEEWGQGSQEVKGTDVYCAGSGRVREEWFSRCREEQALTEVLFKINETAQYVRRTLGGVRGRNDRK